MKTDSSDESPRNAVGPIPLRIGLFSAIVIGVVLGALAISALVSGPADPDSAESPGGATSADESSSRAAPNFSTTLLDGSRFDLAEHLATDGRPVILNFWASWCAPCKAEMPDFDEVSREKPGVRVIGIAVSDTIENATAFAEEIGVSYGLGIDESEVIAAAYPFIGLPSTWFIDEQGVIVREFAGQVTAETLREYIAGDFGF